MEASAAQGNAETTQQTEVGPGGVPKGSKTEEYMRTFNIPERFNNPGGCYLPGNPIFSCSRSMKAPEPEPITDEWFKGYGQKKQNPMFQTTSNTYGGLPPSVFDMPSQFYCRSQGFSEHLGKCGMYRNHSLNTVSDKTIVDNI